MGLGGVINSGLSELGDGWDKGKKLLGKGIDKGTDYVADGLDEVGAHKWADKVEHFGDRVASDLGATPGEQQLGQSEHPSDLVHGRPTAIRGASRHLTGFGAAFESVGQGMRVLDSSTWRGEAAEAFRKKFAMHPPKWLHASDACASVGRGLDDFADTVEWAQGQAQEAIALYKRGKEASEQATDAYSKRVAAYEDAVRSDRDPGPPLEDFQDPGLADIQRARQTLADAREQRNRAGRAVAALINAALKHAPAEPPPLDQLKTDAVDGYGALNTEIVHFGGGLVKGSAGLINFARGLNPEDPYNITHPAAYMQNVSMTLSGLVSTAAHPERVPEALIDSFKKDPAEAGGRLIPQFIGTDGAGLAVDGMRTAVKEGVELGVPTGWGNLAASSPGVTEKAIHAGSVSPEAASAFIDDQFPWLKDVNKTGEPGYTQNCSHNVDAVNRNLDGEHVTAAPKEHPDHVSPEVLGLKDRPKGQYDMVDSYDDIIRDLEKRGEGARSVVYISRNDGTAHVFNAVHTEHGVVFLDGQSGSLGLLESKGSESVNVQQIGHIPYRDGAK